MPKIKIEIGVDVDAFRQSPKDALRTAAGLGFHPVQLSAVEGPIEPRQLTGSGRRHLLRYADGLGLSLVALGADFRGRRFADPASLDERIERTRLILEMAAELRIPVVTARVGPLRSDDSAAGALILEAVRQIADHADKTGTHFAIETAETSPEALQTFLKLVNCPYVRAAYDPAAVLMDGHDPVAGVEPIADNIAAAYIRDATEGQPDYPGEETPIGQGQLDLERYLHALEQTAHASPPILRRTNAQNPTQELADAKQQLQRILQT